MRIKTMDHHLQRRLAVEDEPIFTVHSVFNQACNFLTKEGVWVTIVPQHRWLPPNGMRIDHSKDLRSLFEQGQRVFLPVKDQGIEPMNLDVRSFTIKEKEKETEKKQSIKLEYINTFLTMEGKPEGLAKMDLPGKVDDSFRLLETSLAENDLEKIKAAARGLVGFGKGLTPSMDDYLTGRILMWKARKAFKARRTNTAKPVEKDYSKVIEDVSKGRTTSASEWMIRFAAEGRCSEEILYFLNSFFTKSPGSEFEDAFKEVLQIGSTSGEDLMYGLWSEGIRLLKKYEGGNREWD